MLEILKHLKLQEYNKNVNYILKNFFGKKIHIIDYDSKIQLKNMFDKINDFFIRAQFDDDNLSFKRNMPKYEYIIK